MQNPAHRLTTKSIFGETDAERKSCPVFDGFVMYFPRSMAAIARHSFKANEKHNPGEPLHWARGKSTDHLNTGLRHLMDAGMGILWDGEYNNMVAGGWRIMAALETYLELCEGIDAVSAAKRDMALAEQAQARPAQTALEETQPLPALPGKSLSPEFERLSKIHTSWCGLDKYHLGDCARSYDNL